MSSPSKPLITETSKLISPNEEIVYESVDNFEINTQQELLQQQRQQQQHRHHHHHQHRLQPNQFPEDTFEHAVRDAYESAISDTEHDEDDEDTRWLRQERLNHKLMKWYKRPSLLMIASVMLVYSTAMGISASAKIQLYLELACKKLMLELDPLTIGSGAVDACPKSKVQVVVSQLQGLISILGAIVNTLVAGKIGSCSDIYGRKYLILYILVTGFLSKCATLLLISPAIQTLHTWSLVASHLIDSFGGGMFVFLALCNSYITDVVEDHLRIYAIGIVIANLFVGLSIGPVVGSLIVKFTKSSMVAVYVDIIVTSLAFLLALFILPESRSQNARRKSRRSSIALDEQRRQILIFSKKKYYYSTFLELINVFKPLKMLWLPSRRVDGTKDLRPRIIIILLISIDICLMTCTSVLSPIIILYATYVFDWNAVHMGYYLAINSTTKTLVLLLFSPFFLHQLKKKIKIETKRIDKLDLTCLRFAIFFQTLSALTLTFATNSSQYISHSFFLCFESIATPTLHSTVIKYASIESTGTMFGALATVRNLIHMVMPAAFLYFYSETVALEPRAIFYVQLAFVLLLIILISVLGMDSLISSPDLSTLSGDSDNNSINNLKLQKEQRERVHRYMVMRRESSASINSLLNSSSSPSLPGSPVKLKPLKHSRQPSVTIPKR